MSGITFAPCVKEGVRKMADITYCMNVECFKDCDRHLCRAQNKMVSIAALDSTCRRYIAYLVDEVMGNG